MQDNIYKPPGADLDASDAVDKAAAVIPSKSGWFITRPIPVFIIACWCVLQFVGIVIFMTTYWQDVTELLRNGAESPLTFMGKLLYPALLFLAGVLLLFMRKVAIAAFGLYFAWGCTKAISQNVDFPGYLSLALVLGIVVYCLRLHQLGRLK